MALSETATAVLTSLVHQAKSPGIAEVPYSGFGYLLPDYSETEDFFDQWPAMEALDELSSRSEIEIIEDKRSALIFIPRFLLMTSEHNRMKADRLRLMPYSEYLETWEWAQKVKLVRMRDENACTHCGLCVDVAEMHVHHKTYERRGVERLSDLTTVCAHCHYLIHRFDRGVA